MTLLPADSTNPADVEECFTCDCGAELRHEDDACWHCERVAVGLATRPWENDLLDGTLEVSAADEPPVCEWCGETPARFRSPSAGVPSCGRPMCSACLDYEVAADLKKIHSRARWIA